MNTRWKLNCYLFSNLIAGLLSINYLVSEPKVTLNSVSGNVNTLNKIYEIKKEEVKEIKEVSKTISNNVIVVSKKPVLSEKTVSYIKPSYNSLSGSNLVNYAKNFLGLRYVSGGNSLSTGTDCSGFTKLIYQEFNITLGRTVSSQLSSGSYVSKNDLQPGDLVFYSYGNVASHVAIYIGNGLIIHESTPRDGVKISSVNIMRYITARRIITSNVVIQNENTSTEKIKETTVISETKPKNEEVVEENVITHINVVEDSKPVDTPTNEGLNEEVNNNDSNNDNVIENEIEEEIEKPEENYNNDNLETTDEIMLTEE